MSRQRNRPGGGADLPLTEAQRRLAADHFRLARWASGKYGPRYLPGVAVGDVESECLLGLVDAVRAGAAGFLVKSMNLDRIPPALRGVLGDAVARFEADPEAWVGILTGEGPHFCAGADLKAIAGGQGGELATAEGGFAGWVRSVAFSDSMARAISAN